MAQDSDWEFLAKFPPSLRGGGERDYRAGVSLFRRGDVYCKLFEMSSMRGITPVPLKEDERSQHGEMALQMDGEQARKWIREKVLRIFGDPEALWGRQE